MAYRLGAGRRWHVEADMRYAGQAFEVALPVVLDDFVSDAGLAGLNATSHVIWLPKRMKRTFECTWHQLAVLSNEA